MKLLIKKLEKIKLLRKKLKTMKLLRKLKLEKNIKKK